MTSPQLSFDLDFRPAYGREDFFVGEPNEAAIQSIDRWPDWGSGSPFQIIYGDEGSGKKHIASVWQQRSNASVLDAKTFEDIKLEEIVSSHPNIILHQLHLILGDRELEEKLFHIYNNYSGLTDRKHVLITSRIAPGALETSIPDLQSRLRGSTTFEIRSPDDDLRMQVLGKQLNDKGFQPTEDLLKYSINLMERTWAAPKKLAETLSKMAFDEQKKLTKRMIRDALGSIESGDESVPQQAKASTTPAVKALFGRS